MAKTELRRTLTRAQWVKVFNRADLAYPTGKRDRAMYFFAYYTGIRVGELVNLRLADVDMEKGVFATPCEGKTGQRRLSFPDSKALLDMLDAWLEVRNVEWAVDSPYFFTSQSGGKIIERDFSKALARRAAKAGVEGRVSPHMMRHSYATERIREGVNILDLMSELGHRQLKTTMVYLHQDNGRAVENMRRRRV